jgi:hypothetical protein
MVGHSLGGLVGRAYLSQEGTNNELYKFLTAGTPHQGTSLAYYAWSGGEHHIHDLLWKFATTFVLKHCGGAFGNDRLTIRSLMPSIQNLLPVFDYLQNKKTNVFVSVTSMTDQNNWLPGAPLTPPFFGVNMGTLAGKGFNTNQFIQIKDRNLKDVLLGNWADGKPVGDINTTDGDGTILTDSSLLDGAFHKVINKNHGNLVSSAKGIKEILDFLGTPFVNALNIAPPDQPEEPTALVVISGPNSLVSVDPDGNKKQDTDGFIGILNPKKGNYTLQIDPKTDATTIIIGQFLKNDNILWKEYTFTGKSRKLKNLKFDDTAPLEDPLQ